MSERKIYTATDETGSIVPSEQAIAERDERTRGFEDGRLGLDAQSTTDAYKDGYRLGIKEFRRYSEEEK